MFSENMESLGIYEDLSLFNGDLLLEDASQPAVVEYVSPSLGQNIQDGQLVTTPPNIDVAPIKTLSVTNTLAYPQKGSNDLGLEDLLVGSPTQDQSNPFTASPVWVDNQADLDLFDILEQQQLVQQMPIQYQEPAAPVIQQIVQPVSTLMLPDQQQQQLSASPEPAAIYYPDSPEAAIVPNVNVDVHLNSPNTEPSLMEFEDIQELLLSEFPLEKAAAATTTLNVSSDSGIDLSSSMVQYYPQSPQQQSSVTNIQMDLLNEINQAGLDVLLSSNCPEPVGNMATSLLDAAPILSPVSADDIESILSSTPASPSSEPTAATTTALSSLFTSFTDEFSTISDVPLKSCCPEVSSGSSRPRRSHKEKAVRLTPYSPQPSPASTPVAAPSSGRRTKGDRKERKKEQNRTAALRYREKKRQEGDVLMQEANELEAKNKVLREKVDSITSEIKYLKDLMAEVDKVRKAQAKK